MVRAGEVNNSGPSVYTPGCITIIELHFAHRDSFVEEGPGYVAENQVGEMNGTGPRVMTKHCLRSPGVRYAVAGILHVLRPLPQGRYCKDVGEPKD